MDVLTTTITFVWEQFSRMAELVTSQPILLLPVAIFAAGASIGLVKRLIGKFYIGWRNPPYFGFVGGDNMQDILEYSLDFVFDFMQCDAFVFVLASIMAFVLVNFINLLCRRKKIW